MSKRVLVAPLDWGLGHATRCIPIIRAFLQQDATVILASGGRAYQLLQQEFPSLILEKLPAYNIRYQSGSMVLNIGWQLPKIIWAIWKEHRQLQKLIQKYQIDIVISDNRYGCFSKRAKSIFVTHQINLRIPNILLQSIARFLNRIFIQQFAACWIPDVKGKSSIAGLLAQSSKFLNLKYIGILSRMQPLELPIKQDIIIVLSGPEPQRTRLEALILKQIFTLPYRFLLVQGKPEGDGGGEWGNVGMRDGEMERPRERGKIEIIPFLDAKKLNEAIVSSGLVICRAGYSTIMDLAVLGKKAIFIPTPGQTEQEYLAERLFEKKLFYYQKQRELNLAEALEKVKDFSGFKWQDYEHSREMLKTAVMDLLNPLPS